jgi:hypothetical protein
VLGLDDCPIGHAPEPSIILVFHRFSPCEDEQIEHAAFLCSDGVYLARFNDPIPVGQRLRGGSEKHRHVLEKQNLFARLLVTDVHRSGSFCHHIFHSTALDEIQEINA